MLRSESIAQLAPALAAAQAQFKPIVKNKTAKVRMRAGGEYTYKYATLDAVLESVRPALCANGLCLVQSIEVDAAGHEALRTMLLHATGEFVATDVLMYLGANDNRNQAYGSGLSYAARYGISRLLVLASEDDDDAQGAGDESGQGQEPASRPMPRQQAQERPPPAQPQETEAGEGIALTESQERLLLAKAKGVGLDRDGLLRQWKHIHAGNVNAVLEELRNRAASDK